jgi:hypothetical protein
MSTRSFRTFAQLGLIAGLLTAFAASFSTPAAAAKTSDVVAACKNTPGCQSNDLGGGHVVGCSPKACFDCANGKCHAFRSSDGGKLNYKPGSTSVTRDISSASRTGPAKPTIAPRGDIGPVNSGGGGGGHKH